MLIHFKKHVPDSFDQSDRREEPRRSSGRRKRRRHRRKENSSYRPQYSQANFGPYGPGLGGSRLTSAQSSTRSPRPRGYQSFPSYPRYRQPVRPPPRPNWHLYFLLAFLLLGLMIISLIPILV